MQKAVNGKYQGLPTSQEMLDRICSDPAGNPVVEWLIEHRPPCQITRGRRNLTGCWLLIVIENHSTLTYQIGAQFQVWELDDDDKKFGAYPLSSEWIVPKA